MWNILDDPRRIVRVTCAGVEYRVEPYGPSSGIPDDILSITVSKETGDGACIPYFLVHRKRDTWPSLRLNGRFVETVEYETP